MYDAFDHGVYSYESDVWYDGHTKDFYVAHTALGINHDKTFKTVTLDKVMKILEGKYSDNYPSSNPQKFLDDPDNKPTSHPDWYKYYSEGFGGVRPLQLLLEIKSDDAELSVLKLAKQLEPLRERGWLTKYKDGKIHYGPVIVVGTGGTPFDQIATSSNRDLFLDCPANGIDGTHYIWGHRYTYNSTLCPLASSGYSDVKHANHGILPPRKSAITQFHKVIETSHHHGATTRFYGILDLPSRIEDFNMLIQQGSDRLNIDDLNDAKRYSH